MSVTCLPESLISAYRATRYRVFTSPDFELAVGQRSSALAGLCRAHAANSAAFLTAWNPEGNLQSEPRNREAFARLRARVASHGVTVIAGFGEDPDGAWAGEESLLALGLSREAACDIGAEFRQNAIVWAGADAVPELILLR
jgi:hypothetical protein